MKELRDLPEAILKKRTEILNLDIQGMEIKEKMKQEKVKKSIEIQNAINPETGKLLYSNSEVRENQLYIELNSDEEYCMLKDEIRKINFEKETEVFNLEFLENKFKANLAISRILSGVFEKEEQ